MNRKYSARYAYYPFIYTFIIIYDRCVYIHMQHLILHMDMNMNITNMDINIHGYLFFIV